MARAIISAKGGAAGGLDVEVARGVIAIGLRVAVAVGAGVSVGGTGVAVGTGVFVGGTGVAVGANVGVLVGSNVAVGRTGVEVSGSVGTTVGVGGGVAVPHPASNAIEMISIKQRRDTANMLLLAKLFFPASSSRIQKNAGPPARQLLPQRAQRIG